ncbi:hypothetical protein BDA96_03G381300 [Sorghum bicolor]|uniref:Uncharacterized protein n=1 Tax=Sorghum bicolor TaxID=4558 RepID=A0A921UPY2_SORBI|nr:hypothetical protein BDA96_03G381300 [Sorghum bicolor]
MRGLTCECCGLGVEECAGASSRSGKKGKDERRTDEAAPMLIKVGVSWYVDG